MAISDSGNDINFEEDEDIRNNTHLMPTSPRLSTPRYSTIKQRSKLLEKEEEKILDLPDMLLKKSLKNFKLFHVNNNQQ